MKDGTATSGWRRGVLLAVAAVGLTAVFGVDRAYRAQIRRDNQTALANTADRAALALRDLIAERVKLVEDLKAFMLARPDLPDAASFERYAAAVVRHYPHVLALQYVDPGRLIRWTHPLEGNEAALNLDLTTRPTASFVEQAIRERRTTVSHPTATVQGPLAIVARAPLYDDERFLGLAQSVVDIEPILQELKQRHLAGCVVRIVDAAGQRFHGPLSLPGPVETRPVKIDNAPWTLAVAWQTPPYSTSTFLMTVIWVGGGTLLASLLFATHLAWTWAERLKVAVAQRTVELVDTQNRLTTVLNSAPVTIFGIDSNGVFTVSEGQGLAQAKLEPGENVGASAIELYRDLPVELQSGEITTGAEVVRRVLAGETLRGVTELNGVSFENAFVPHRDQAGNIVGLIGVAFDVTDSRRAADELREAKDLLDRVFTSLADAVFLVDPRTRVITACNRAVENVFGYRIDEVVGRNTEILHVDRAMYERFGRELFPTLDAGGVFRTEFKVRRKDGQVFESEHTVAEVRDEAGDRVRVVSVVRDVTEANRNRELLKAQHDLLQSAAAVRDLGETLQLCLDTAVRVSGMDCGGVYLVHEDGGLRLARATGLSAEFTEAASRYAADAPNTCLVTAGEPVYAHYPDIGVPTTGIERREGLQALAVIPIRHKGRVIGCLNVASHRTGEVPPHSRKALETIASSIGLVISRGHADDALQASEERLRVALKGAEIILAHVDTDLRYTWISNPHSDFPAESVVGKRDTELARNAGTEQLERLKRRVLESGRGGRETITFPLLDGPQTYDVTAEPLRDIEGRRVGLTTAALNVTERMRAEEELRNSREQMRELAGQLQVVREQERQGLARELHDQVGQAITTLGLTLSIVANHLRQGEEKEAAERLTDGRGQLNEVLTQIRAVIDDLRPLVLDDTGLVSALHWVSERFTRRTGIGVDVLVPEEEPCLKAEQETALFRILQEALSNVAKHASATQVTVSLEAGSETLEMEVADNGKGFDVAAVQARPQRRGLGLLTMAERAEAMGGTLAVESVPGKGTRVTVAVPNARLDRPSDAGGEDGARIPGVPEGGRPDGC